MFTRTPIVAIVTMLLICLVISVYQETFTLLNLCEFCDVFVFAKNYFANFMVSIPDHHYYACINDSQNCFRKKPISSSS